MKKLLLTLLCLPMVFSCNESENRVLIDELTNKGNWDTPLMYLESGLFNGIGFDVYPSGRLKEERNYKNGKEYGLRKGWYENGKIFFETNYKDSQRNGLDTYYYENGELRSENNYKKNKKDGLQKGWFKNGQIWFQDNYKDGKEVGRYKNGQGTLEVSKDELIKESTRAPKEETID